MTDTFTLKVNFVLELCPECGVSFGITSDYHNRRRNDHRSFYCPNGHSQFYPGESDVDKLRRELHEREIALRQQQRQAEDERMRADMEAQQRKAAERDLAKVKRRIAAGVCPCCNRHFTNLERHIGTKHPDYQPPAATPQPQQPAARRRGRPRKEA